MTEAYKIRATLLGHSLDVRGVAAGETEGGKQFVVSASRDKTAKVWIPTELGAFEVFQSCDGHTNFISCVCVIPSSSKYPKGLIVTGGHDYTALAFEIGTPTPVFRLQGHKGTVCSIRYTTDNIIVTGSWDNTASLWEDHNVIATLSGHDAAVWAVAVLAGGGRRILTGSADKTIRLWEGNQTTKIFRGHTDCVRTVATIDSNRFLSASNDACIRLWNVAEGECVNILYGHTNFIYSLALFPNGEDFASVGEDRTLRIWKGNDCRQTIHLPAMSVWSVDVMKNGDIVTGSSDGTVRIFTADPDRMASPEEIIKFEEEVGATSIAAQQDLGGMKVSALPGLEALLKEGKTDGDTKMIREGSQVSCYSWSAAERKWVKVGDVVGASGATQNTSGRVLHEGMEYDYVFSVDLDGTATLKLPYNISEDPWFAAKRFLDKNELNPQFLDQVANFIITNTKGMQLGTSNDSSYADPFTGGNRYVPAVQGSSTGPSGGSIDGLDPFTGSGAYRTQTAVASTNMASSNSNQKLSNQPCFPTLSFLQFTQAPNAEGLKTKLTEFIHEMGVSATIGDETIIYFISKVLEGQYTEEVHVLLQNFLDLPRERVFPVLDLIRVGCLNEDFARNLVEKIPIIEQLVPKFVSADSPTNQMLMLRILNNLFGKQTSLLMNHRSRIVSAVMNTLAKAKNNQIAAGTLFLNYSVVLTTSKETNPEWTSVETQTELLMAILSIVDLLEEHEAVYRLLVAMGNLLVTPLAIQLFKSLSGDTIARNYKQNGGLAKIQQCAGEILDLLHNRPYAMWIEEVGDVKLTCSRSADDSQPRSREIRPHSGGGCSDKHP